MDEAPPGFAAGRAGALVRHGACAAVYAAIPGCREHQASADWTSPAAWAPVVAELRVVAARAYARAAATALGA